MAGDVITVEGLSKRYRLGQRASYGRLSESLYAAIRRPFVGRPATGAHVWALRDVSFGVAEGEVLGIIGRNGSGKTTLLKVLSRVTEPTEGEALVEGRVGSLLEVGTGFHPELTGRENIWLAGAVLGMRRSEVAASFDEIVEFSEIAKFLETPVKRYSSGMYVRLAFAVAAHLQTDVLLVDEVLAVGDAAFQKKCLGKLDDAAGGGRTVLFVSHDMAAVEHLCSRAILIGDGRIEMDGGPREVVGRYLSDAGSRSPVVRFGPETPRHGSGDCVIDEVRLSGGEEADLRVRTGGRLEVTVSFRSVGYSGSVVAGLLLKDDRDRFLCDVRSVHSGTRFEVADGGSYEIRAMLPSLALYPGEYGLGVWVARPTTEDFDYIPDACRFEVEDDGGLLEDGRLDPRWGRFYLESSWGMTTR